MFLAPWILVGLLAAAIPLVLHLRRSTKVRKITFSTTRFFDEQFIKSSRRARLQDRLLMALRIALLCLFVLALAQPLVKLPWLSGLAGLGMGRRNVAIVLDDSASMGAVTADGVLFDRAKAGALSLLDDLSPARGDRVTVILAGQQQTGPRVLFEEPTANLEEARQAVRSLRVTDLGTDVGAAVAKARGVLGGGPEGAGTAGNREIYVFSDLQSSGVALDVENDLDAETGVFFVSTRPPAGDANLSIDAIQYGAPRPMLGVPFTFRALVTNHSDAPATPMLALHLDGQATLHKPVEVPAGRSKVVRFTHRFTKPGWFGGHIELSASPDDKAAFADHLAADNRRHFAVQVQDRVRVLAVNGAPSAVAAKDELFFLRLALTVNPQAAGDDTAAKSPPIRVDTVGPVEITPAKLQDYRLVVLANVANLSPAALESLEQYVDAGGNLFVTLGDRVTADFYNQWTGDNRLHGGLLPGRLTTIIQSRVADRGSEEDASAAESTTRDPQPATADPSADAGFVASVEQGHPALAGFGEGQLGSLTTVTFTARWVVDPRGADVLMRASSGDPLLLEKRFGRGRVMMFASSIDRDWTNFPLQPSFVAWGYRLVGYLAQSQVENANFVRTGQVVAIPASATRVSALQVETPDRQIAYPAPVAGVELPTGNAAFAATERAGLYTVRQGGAEPDAAPLMLFAANIPSDEADAQYLLEPDLREMMGAASSWMFIDGPETVVDAGRVARQGFGLWDQLLFVALLVALFEPWLANRLSKRRGPASGDALGQRDVAEPIPAARANAA